MTCCIPLSSLTWSRSAAKSLLPRSRRSKAASLSDGNGLIAVSSALYRYMMSTVFKFESVPPETEEIDLRSLRAPKHPSTAAPQRD